MDTTIDRSTVDDDDPGIEQVDQLEELERHDGYRAYRLRIEAELKRRCLNLEMPIDEQQTHYYRGWIAALRWVLQCPEQMREQTIAEIQKAERR